jgi:hypothetical protein
MQPVMQKQEDPFNLRGLPMVEPPGDSWPAVEAALRQDKQRQTAWRYAGVALAAAATVTLVLGLVLRQPMPSAAEQTLVQTATPTDQPGSAANSAAPDDSTETLEAMIALSQTLESRLRTIRNGVGGLPASSVVYQAELEDLVAQVDEQLSAAPDSLPMWSQRVSLLMDLERLYENRLRREYQQMASL